MTASQCNTSPTIIFEVAKNDLNKTRTIPLDIGQSLAEDEVLLKVDKFALTANNISYGVAGDALGYWRFFPTEDVDEQTRWGRLPVMGYADVVSSNCKNVNVGERVWGFMPMATHVKILGGRISDTSFSDISPNRKGFSPFYSAFERVRKNPFYRPENENYDVLLRGLFTTSWLVDDFMFDNDYFAAQQYLITSASSKTSIALAFAIQQRGERPAIGITSHANRSFVESLGCYQHVVCYDEISRLNNHTPSILVDMAGGTQTLTSIHNHFADKLMYSCRIGATQHSDINIDDTFTLDNLPGAKPIFFFAPTQLKKRMLDWGAGETMKQTGSSLLRYIEFCRSTITIQHTTDVTELDAIYQQVLAGTADASTGQIISL
jgi:hypothetical protein